MRKETELIEHLKMLGLDEQEARIYLYLIRNGSVSELDILSDLKIDNHSAIESLLSKGVLIRNPADESKVMPLHPRNGAANLYKLLQDRAIKELREKRRIADRLGMVLEPEFEAAQGKM